MLLGKANYTSCYCVYAEFFLFSQQTRIYLFLYYKQGDLLFKASTYFDYQDESGILGCLLLSLLLNSNFSLHMEQLLLLDEKLKAEYRSGWKDLTKGLTFSSSTVPQRKGSPSTRKRDSKSMNRTPEEDEISQMLSHKRAEKLNSLAGR